MFSGAGEVVEWKSYGVECREVAGGIKRQKLSSSERPQTISPHIAVTVNKVTVNPRGYLIYLKPY